MARRAGRTFIPYEHADIHYYYELANRNTRSSKVQRLYIEDIWATSDQYMVEEEYPVMEYLVVFIIELLKLVRFLLLRENKAPPLMTIKGMKSNWRNKFSC